MTLWERVVGGADRVRVAPRDWITDIAIAQIAETLNG